MQNNQNSSSHNGAVGVRFEHLGLSMPLLNAVAGQGYEHPTPIQAQAVPPILNGRDVMAAAQTGTGKTAGFTLPILQRLSGNIADPESDTRGRADHNSVRKREARNRIIRALIITPTRELAAQVEQSVRTYGGNLPLQAAVVFGGVKINPQIEKLRRGVDILVATPGRLLDLHGQGAVDLSHVEILVLDEADRMLDMGFIHDIRKILRILPEKRQNLMFSATFSDEIRSLARGILHNPVEISVSPMNSTVDTVRQWIVPTEKERKTDLLIHLINEENWYQALVFSRTKHGANRIAQKLEKTGIQATAIHGNKSQNARTRALGDFKSGKLRILVATDIAARGLDISQLSHVVNYDLPNVSEDYVHRIGRTGRAGAQGTALSLVCSEEIKQLRDIEKLIGKTVDRRTIPGFEPLESFPMTSGPKSGGQSRKLNEKRPAGRPSGGQRTDSGRSSERNGGSGGYRQPKNFSKKGSVSPRSGGRTSDQRARSGKR